jgi:hypothetical protein
MDVTIEVTNIVGQHMSTQVYQDLSSGKHRLNIDGSALASGVYVLKVKAGDEMITRTMNVQ